MNGLMSKQIPEAVDGVWRLTDVDICFVSACPQGANPGAKILLKKEQVMSGKTLISKENNNAGTDDNKVVVNFDTASFAKSVSESLKSALTDILKKDGVTAEAAAEACSAVLAGDIAKMQKDINDQLATQVGDLQKSFDAKLAEIQSKSESINKQAADEAVTVNGVTFQKSAVGDATFAALKAACAQSEAVRKELEQQKLMARVEKEYPNVAGEPLQKAQLLGMIEGCADQKLREYGLGILKSLNDVSAEYSKEIGTNSNNSTDPAFGVEKMQSDTDASLKLDAMAKELATKENISVAKAYQKVLKTEEGAKLYSQHCSN